MVFPVSYKDFSLPKYIDYTLSFLGLLKDLLFVTLFYYSGVEAFLDPDIRWSTRSKTRHDILLPSPLVVLTRELLPVVKYCEIVNPPESCAVCLYEFSGGEEIRRLMNCRHVFHRECVDRWMDNEQMTCPLCRTPFISDDMQEALNVKLWSL
ncbi:hypothetical protein DCAR_0100413 [Daucus carota subsp. sativus]|uniref:RING-type domain-containing protein n=1 Tax=Daucus carota subsp. sativus TaxID=79200 RepID=A0A162AZ85_DAUCS|nr:hypothetical protein DCAR_0100413 [Daucus carota subsp. sativus]